MMTFIGPMELDSKGYSFIEVLIAVILISVGSVTLLRTFGVGMFADAELEKSTEALYLAQESLESIKDASSYANINSFSLARVNIGGDFSDYDREITVSGDPKEVSVTVYWQSKGDELSQQLVTLMADYGYD